MCFLGFIGFSVISTLFFVLWGTIFDVRLFSISLALSIKWISILPNISFSFISTRSFLFSLGMIASLMPPLTTEVFLNPPIQTLPLCNFSCHSNTLIGTPVKAGH